MTGGNLLDDSKDQLNDDQYCKLGLDLEEHFRKTFITNHNAKEEEKTTFTLHDIMIPAGRTAKLI